MTDSLLTIKQLAAYLSLNERTVLKLVQEGTLPGVRIGNQWRFRKAMIDTWLDDQALGLTPRHIGASDIPIAGRMLSLTSCLQASHIIADLQGRTKAAAIVELCAHAHRLGLVRDATWFVGALIERESVIPSATGRGLAFLHTLRRHPEQVVRPFLVLGRSREGIDFDALDGRPTHLAFVLGLKYEELHLPWLAKLVQMLANPTTVDELMAGEDASRILTLLMASEQNLQSSVAAHE